MRRTQSEEEEKVAFQEAASSPILHSFSTQKAPDFTQLSRGSHLLDGRFYAPAAQD